MDYTIKRINTVLWQLTRFRNLGAPTDTLLQLNILKVRSILMFGLVCFHSSLTQELSHKLELQQGISLAVILGSQYRSYRHSLSLTSLPRLDTLREEACLKQTCTNTRNTSIPPGVLSFQVVFVNKFNLMEDILLLLFWPVSKGLD